MQFRNEIWVNFIVFKIFFNEMNKKKDQRDTMYIKKSSII